MRSLIKNYVEKITSSDIMNFSRKNGVNLNDDEVSILFFYLKNNWEDFLYGDPTPIIDEIEKKIDVSKSEKILNLFNDYFNKYKNYL